MNRLIENASHRAQTFISNLLSQGLTMASIKHHVALQPLFVIMGFGIVFVSLYVGRFEDENVQLLIHLQLQGLDM